MEISTSPKTTHFDEYLRLGVWNSVILSHSPVFFEAKAMGWNELIRLEITGMIFNIYWL